MTSVPEDPMTGERREGVAVVAQEDGGCSVDVLGQRVITGAWQADARHIANRLNHILSPLVRRAELAEKAAKRLTGIGKMGLLSFEEKEWLTAWDAIKGDGE